ncbi:hypothetical protein C3941_02950 [Kaistia algarum]|nr:hypothetical protein C3941_02950 [Kaistia algarum]
MPLSAECGLRALYSSIEAGMASARSDEEQIAKWRRFAESTKLNTVAFSVSGKMNTAPAPVPRLRTRPFGATC